MSWPMTAELTRDALNALNIPAGRLTELLLRYIGEHEDEPALARALTTENTDVDLDAWPFDRYGIEQLHHHDAGDDALVGARLMQHLLSLPGAEGALARSTLR